MKLTSQSQKFVKAHDTIWGIMPDSWDFVNPCDCHMFMSGFVQMAKDGRWFPYRASNSIGNIEVNLTNPHLIKYTKSWHGQALGDWSKDL